MAHYKALGNPDRIAKSKSIQRRTNHVPGLSGVNKKGNIDIHIQENVARNKHFLNILDKAGNHISSYAVTTNKLICIAEEKFWLWQKRKTNF